jgi:hypothetical protein
MEKRTQWLTEAILGNRSENMGYQEKTSEFDRHMEREYGATQHDVNGIYADPLMTADQTAQIPGRIYHASQAKALV